MKETLLLKYCSILVILLINLSSLNTVESETYTVGDDEEWNTGTNYLTWSGKYNFSVGDILVFKYVKSQHNAYEVTQNTYRSCDASSGVLNKYESGDDKVTLSVAKKYWFICNVSGHCLGGMKFGIDVNEGSNSTSVTPTTEPSPSPPLDNNGGLDQGRKVVFWACLAAEFGILQAMNW